MKLLARWVARSLSLLVIAAVLVPIVAARDGGTVAAVAIGIEVAAALVVWRLLGPAIADERRRQQLAHEARLLVRETRRILRKRGYRIEPRIAREIAARAEALEDARLAGDVERLREGVDALEREVETHLSFARKSTVREYAESVGAAVLIALLLRSFVVEAFKIPSGSMIPTLQDGDHIFVNKFVYGLGWPLSGYKFWTYHKPNRGEVIVFKYPPNPSIDYIKRVIGVEGDTVQVNGMLVYVNGRALPRSYVGQVQYRDYSEDSDTPVLAEQRTADAFDETLDGRHYTIYLSPGLHHAARCPPGATFGCGSSIQVPPGHVFVMGDNRDNSSDSRFWGFVPDENIKGKALFIWYSGDPTRSLLEGGVRFRRIGQPVR